MAKTIQDMRMKFNTEIDILKWNKRMPVNQLKISKESITSKMNQAEHRVSGLKNKRI